MRTNFTIQMVCIFQVVLESGNQGNIKNLRNPTPILDAFQYSKHNWKFLDFHHFLWFSDDLGRVYFANYKRGASG